MQDGWYHNVVYMGKESDVPVVTMTYASFDIFLLYQFTLPLEISYRHMQLYLRCTLSDVESFKSGKFPLCDPATEYANTLVRGLVEGKRLSEEEAMTYIQENCSKPL